VVAAEELAVVVVVVVVDVDVVEVAIVDGAVVAVPVPCGDAGVDATLVGAGGFFGVSSLKRSGKLSLPHLTREADLEFAVALSSNAFISNLRDASLSGRLFDHSLTVSLSFL